MKTLITGIALGAIGYSVYTSLRRQAQLQSPDGIKPEPLQRWEDEGGNVPAANTALKTARTDDLLSPSSAKDDAPVAASTTRTGFPGSPIG